MPPRGRVRAAVPEVSVVVVHGIGSQAAGQTAREWAESSTDFLTRSGTPARIVDVVPPGIGQPPAYTVAVHAPGSVAGPAVARLRFVDAQWADAFVAPSVAAVVRWMLLVGPHLAVAQAVLGARRRVQDERRAAGGRIPRAVHAWWFLRRILPVVFALASVAVLAPVLALVALVLVVVTVLPGSGPGTALARTLGFLSFGVGDVTTILRDDVAHQAIRARVRWVVERETTRTRDPSRVHVLAHSQGGAISHDVLRAIPAARRPHGFTTVGAATGRLRDLRALDPLPRWSAPVAVSSGLAALSILPVAGAGGLLALVPVTWIVAVGAAQWLYWMRRFGADEDLPRLPVIPGVTWLDLWAPFDLVPNGRPVAPGAPGYRATLVPGGLSVLHDHTAYARDLAETVPRVLAHLGDQLGRVPALAARPGALAPGGAQLGARRGLRARRPLADPEGTGANWMPWEGRDWLQLWLRGLTWLVAVALVVVPGLAPLAPWGHRLRAWSPLDATVRVLERWFTTASGFLRPEPPPCCSDLSGALGAAGVLVGAAAGGAVAWRAVRALQARALDRWLDSGLVLRSERQLAWSLVAVVALWLAVAVAAVLLARTGPG